jgi:hypothetical protein
VSCGGTLEGALERKGKTKGPEEVTLSESASGEDGSGVVGRPAEKHSRGPAVCPGKEMQEGGGVFLGWMEDVLERHAVEGVLLV